MVHSWIRLVNDKIVKPCINPKVVSIFQNSESRFYGDYDLDIFIGTKHDYHSLEETISSVIETQKGWISNCKLEHSKQKVYSLLSQIISEFGYIENHSIKKILPKKENQNVLQTLELRNDGNFKMISCETEKFYYVFCFATS